jgi:hypothetical protein
MHLAMTVRVDQDPVLVTVRPVMLPAQDVMTIPSRIFIDELKAIRTDSLLPSPEAKRLPIQRGHHELRTPQQEVFGPARVKRVRVSLDLGIFLDLDTRHLHEQLVRPAAISVK